MSDSHEQAGGEPMMIDDETVRQIDVGEPRPGVDMRELIDDLGTLLSAVGHLLHLQGHDFVETKDLRPDVEALFGATGQILFQLSEA